MFRVLPIAATILLLTPGCAAKKIHTLEEEIAQKDNTIQNLTAENQGYLIQISTLNEEVARLGKKNEELAALYTAITNEFGPQIESGQAALVVYPDRSMIVIGDQITFDSASARLTKDSAAAIDELASFLKNHPERRFQVEGHTDSEPIHNAQFASNWELGAARALTVVKELVDRGVSETQLSAATYGDTEPLATNMHPDGMATNRRIAVSVETSMSESGAQQALLEAAKRAGGPVFAQSRPVDTSRVAGLEAE